jgi:hypothetical protein
MEYGNLNLPEPSGPHRSVMGMIYLYHIYIYIYIGIRKKRTEIAWY